MPLYIFECRTCGHLIKQALESFSGKVYTYDCPQCEGNDKFKLIREVDPNKDWFNNMLRIHNRRRRAGDRLHQTDNRGENDNKEN